MATKQITFDNYYQDTEYLSNSMLGYFKKSYLHYEAYINGKLVSDTPALRFGSAYDCFMLEPHLFEDTYIVMPKGMRRNTKAYTEWRNHYNNDKSLIELSSSEMNKLVNMQDALMNYKEVYEMLAIGEKQKIAMWEEDGIKRKGKFDNYIGGCCVIDLKTSKDASPQGFEKSLKYLYDYDRQAAWYIDGASTLKENKNIELEFFWVVQEKESPYIPALYKASIETLNNGRLKYHDLLLQYKEYLRSKPEQLYKEI